MRAQNLCRGGIHRRREAGPADSTPCPKAVRPTTPRPTLPVGPTLMRSAAHSVSEEDFWRNYFSHVFAVKRSFAQTTLAVPNGPVKIEVTSAMSVAARVSYPEKFHLAAKYAIEGPSLPNLSDADRVLLHALYQQVRAAPPNAPPPHPPPRLTNQRPAGRPRLGRATRRGRGCGTRPRPRPRTSRGRSWAA